MKIDTWKRHAKAELCLTIASAILGEVSDEELEDYAVGLMFQEEKDLRVKLIELQNGVGNG